eukprot:TRINITY_DN16269_c0_g1::TRINITY_DN16269_c0_g1_i1::g.3137::m.3137 TRINITY_DN16269_c0_g1::TRINITY_DN16269_c0_g1_i1::g.3137  ORF type:complete len:161 (+),score=-2.71,sp/Q9LZV8/ATL74_ARATH/34.57/5e-11,zf-RING_2/PF13639.1/1.6e-14,zf-C3HC4_2/PF13923.1/7e-08,zf-C3HC4_3/PF13920.1/3.8e-07,zf-rbx1/PF12678.2/2.7e-06,zf-C3HC4/PF00097.20/2.1e-06,zf-RING_5/PF14634.1/5.4e-06,zf-RING_UBOX/PF13445.1/0.00034,zf-Apc11/PF12861.2/0.036,Baculo_RING/PF05883.6/0.035,RINGv/PF12906.2/0.066,zf-C3HC4_4/PF15227.1/0.064,Rtf2
MRATRGGNHAPVRPSARDERPLSTHRPGQSAYPYIEDPEHDWINDLSDSGEFDDETLEAAYTQPDTQNDMSYEQLLALDEAIQKRGGLSTEQFKRLEVVSALSVTQRECTICLDRYSTCPSLRRLPCGHLFHDSCLKTWFKEHHKCPNCRYNVKDNHPES